MKLCVIRHGQTEWNRKNVVLGRTDIPLDETGKEQAKELAQKLKEVPIDLAFTSPLQRARDTCTAVCAARSIPVIVKDELIEMDFGIYEGGRRDDVLYQLEKANYFARFKGGESFMDVAARIYPLLTGLEKEYPEKTILLVTHNGICRVINSYFYDMTNDAFRTFQLKNCGILEYDL